MWRRQGRSRRPTVPSIASSVAKSEEKIRLVVPKLGLQRRHQEVVHPVASRYRPAIEMTRPASWSRPAPRRTGNCRATPGNMHHVDGPVHRAIHPVRKRDRGHGDEVDPRPDPRSWTRSGPDPTPRSAGRYARHHRHPRRWPSRRRIARRSDRSGYRSRPTPADPAHVRPRCRRFRRGRRALAARPPCPSMR